MPPPSPQSSPLASSRTKSSNRRLLHVWVLLLGFVLGSAVTIMLDRLVQSVNEEYGIGAEDAGENIVLTNILQASRGDGEPNYNSNVTFPAESMKG